VCFESGLQTVFILYVVFIFFVWREPNRKMRLRSPRPGGAQRRGCDRFHLGPFESEPQLDPSVLLRPELEPLPERRQPRQLESARMSQNTTVL